MKKLSIVSLFLILSLLSCSQRQIEKQGLERLKATVEEFRSAINTGDAEKVAEMWADDAIFMSNGMETVKGKDKVTEIWKRNVKGGFRTKNHETIELATGGDTGYEVVTQLWTVHEEGKEDVWHPSKYVHIWKKQKDDSWKLHLDIWNTNPEPEGER